jgi:hypothetical protein
MQDYLAAPFSEAVSREVVQATYERVVKDPTPSSRTSPAA